MTMRRHMPFWVQNYKKNSKFAIVLFIYKYLFLDFIMVLLLGSDFLCNFATSFTL